MIEGQFKPLQKLQFEQFEDFTVGGLGISYFGAAQSSASTVTWPASIQAGDAAFLFDANRSVSTPAEVIPSGFTKITGDSTSSSRGTASYKLCVGTETGSLTGQNGLTQNAKILIVFRGSSPISTITIGSANAKVTTGDPVSQSVTASGQAAPLIVLGQACYDSGTAAFSTASPAFDSTFGTGVQLVGYKIYNTSPANHSIDQSDGGSFNFLTSFYARFT